MFNRSRRMRRERIVEKAVFLQAEAVSEVIIDGQQQGRVPPYRFNAQKPPTGVHADEFLERVGSTAMRIVNGEMPDNPLFFDVPASLQATYELASPGSSHKSAAKLGEVIVIFSQRQQIEYEPLRAVS